MTAHPDPDLIEYTRRMRQDWDERAKENARHYIADGKPEWSEDEFYKSGGTTVAQDILTDMYNICQGRDPRNMRVLELGCGAGRVTRALAGVFGEVHGADVSGEMVRQARAALSACPNVRIHQVDGMTLEALGDLTFDFAYSCCVFHHIASYDVIRSYVRDIGVRLKPGALFKFEVQGCTNLRTGLGDTWLGVPFSEEQARAMAAECGFEMRYHVGAGEERYWLWYFRLD